MEKDSHKKDLEIKDLKRQVRELQNDLKKTNLSLEKVKEDCQKEFDITLEKALAEQKEAVTAAVVQDMEEYVGDLKRINDELSAENALLRKMGPIFVESAAEAFMVTERGNSWISGKCMAKVNMFLVGSLAYVNSLHPPMVDILHIPVDTIMKWVVEQCRNLDSLVDRYVRGVELERYYQLLFDGVPEFKAAVEARKAADAAREGTKGGKRQKRKKGESTTDVPLQGKSESLDAQGAGSPLKKKATKAQKEKKDLGTSQPTQTPVPLPQSDPAQPPPGALDDVPISKWIPKAPRNPLFACDSTSSKVVQGGDCYHVDPDKMGYSVKQHRSKPDSKVVSKVRHSEHIKRLLDSCNFGGIEALNVRPQTRASAAAARKVLDVAPLAIAPRLECGVGVSTAGGAAAEDAMVVESSGERDEDVDV